MLYPGQLFGDSHFAAFMSEVRERLRQHYPYRMAVQMALQPLDLNRTFRKIAAPLLVRATRRFDVRLSEEYGGCVTVPKS